MFTLILAATLAAGPKTMPKELSYKEAETKCLKEGKLLFVWRGLKDDYVINKYPDAVHLIDPVLPKNDLLTKGVIVSRPNGRDLEIQIETANVAELAFKLVELPKSTPQPSKTVTVGKIYNLGGITSYPTCTNCQKGK